MFAPQLRTLLLNRLLSPSTTHTFTFTCAMYVSHLPLYQTLLALTRMYYTHPSRSFSSVTQASLPSSPLPSPFLPFPNPTPKCGVSFTPVVSDLQTDSTTKISAPLSGVWHRMMVLVMQLRKVCNHPYMFRSAEPGNVERITGEDIVEGSGEDTHASSLMFDWPTLLLSAVSVCRKLWANTPEGCSADLTICALVFHTHICRIALQLSYSSQ